MRLRCRYTSPLPPLAKPTVIADTGHHCCLLFLRQVARFLEQRINHSRVSATAYSTYLRLAQAPAKLVSYPAISCSSAYRASHIHPPLHLKLHLAEFDRTSGWQAQRRQSRQADLSLNRQACRENLAPREPGFLNKVSIFKGSACNIWGSQIELSQTVFSIHAYAFV